MSWDQLRSPQVSQFLLKPIQQEIRLEHFSRATEYALITNCLQFTKEISLNPGNSGANRTRAMVCELLAIKLLKEYTARELIDALSYDFDPLQGQGISTDGAPLVRRQRAARISCLEVAVRAQAKRFLAHPQVVQQLEAIWAGSIVFHSAADNMHRARSTVSNRAYGSVDADSSKLGSHPDVSHFRRAVTLYDPQDASLFKLSRLRVPRYRTILSTLSFAVLLCLFVAVLTRRSLQITALEVVFWFWSAGYMLDEIVGYQEQGFSLYLASFWNTFDLGILLLLLIHLCFRLYGLLMPEARKRHVASMAYDVLAADAVLLFPRLFSVLDHYRYFSQLLIAFRMMASDLAAVFVLILVSCSGFFVALTLSFGNEVIDTPGTVAYVLLQILMGFTPAAWDRWSEYNALGKTILTLFLFICHFLVVTILITVLTNSFMAIVQNANEEHQFVFAVNIISMVKSDALFSYVAPTNILAWLLTPLRFFMPFRKYVSINRTVIKITHFPVLLTIMLYEKIILRSSMVDTIGLVEPRGRAGSNIRSNTLTPKVPRLAREPSIVTYRKDRALEEVFRKNFDDSIRTTQKSQGRRSTSNNVSKWMSTMGGGILSPPQEQDRRIVDRLEAGQSSLRYRYPVLRKGRIFTDATMRSVASDPEEFTGNTEFQSLLPRLGRTQRMSSSNIGDTIQQTDADGDDELITNENDDEDKLTLDHGPIIIEDRESQMGQTVRKPDYFMRRASPTSKTPAMSTSISSAGRARFVPQPAEHPRSHQESPPRVLAKGHPHLHHRNFSNATVVFNPLTDSANEASSSQDNTKAHSGAATPSDPQLAVPDSGAMTPVSKPTSSGAGRRTPKNPISTAARPRPIMPPKDYPGFKSVPDLAGLTMVSTGRPANQPRSSLAMDIGSDIGDNKAAGGGYIAPIPASFTTQMIYTTAALSRPRVESEDREMFGRLVLARMNNLEEGFREVVHEMRDHIRRNDSRSESRDHSGRHTHRQSRKGKDRKRGEERGKGERPRAMFSKTADNTRTNSNNEWVEEADEAQLPRGSSI